MNRAIKPLEAFLISEAFGTYFLAGAFWGFSNGAWPVFMPPQLDLFWLLFSIFGDSIGLYLGVALLALLGMTSCGIGIIFLLEKPPHHNRERH